MVTSRNIILAGLGAVILAAIASRGLFSGNGAITKEEIITPEILPPEPVPIVINPQIQILKDAIAGVQGFIRQTFKPTKVLKDPVTGGKCRGPNCLGIFAARGTRTAIDPFTGTRVAIGATRTFSSVTGTSQAQLAANLRRITQGGNLFTQASNIIKDLQGQLSILETKSV